MTGKRQAELDALLVRVTHDIRQRPLTSEEITYVIGHLIVENERAIKLEST